MNMNAKSKRLKYMKRGGAYGVNAKATCEPNYVECNLYLTFKQRQNNKIS